MERLEPRIVTILFILLLGTPLLTFGGETLPIQIGEIQLGTLDGTKDVHLYEIQPSEYYHEVSIGLFGHIYRDSDPPESYLALPWMILEEQNSHDPSSSWIPIGESQTHDPDIAVTRLQNIPLEDGFRYRIQVRTTSSSGGCYALIADPVLEGYELEIEDLDLGDKRSGTKYLLGSAYSIPDPSLPSGVRIYVGTEEGYILKSENDAKTWKKIYPPEDAKPEGTIYGLFADSQGIIYASPWTAYSDYLKYNRNGYVVESRDEGKTWSVCLIFQWPTGVAWRIAEDWEGNVFIGEYSASIPNDTQPRSTGNIWRRENHGMNGEPFELVFANPSENPDTALNHVHFVGVDPYTDDVYAAIGDGAVGRMIRSRQHGDPGTWETLQQGVDAQYTSMAFTPDSLFAGQDTNKQYKKLVRLDKQADLVRGDEPFWTSVMIDHAARPLPIPWADRGNWFWGHYLEKKKLLLFQYLPYGTDVMDNSQMQPPRLYAGINEGKTWWRAITFPPVPVRDTPQSGFYGPKLASNVGPNGWIYAMRGTVSESIHRGFRFRLKPDTASSVGKDWIKFK